MATWHQRRNMPPLWHETQWTIVFDPPNDVLTIERHETEALANTRMAQLKQRGERCYVIQPASASLRKPR